MAVKTTRVESRPYGVRDLPTWEMTVVELARTWAAHFGYEGRPGGWIYDDKGRPVAHGWDVFAAHLARNGHIAQGSGINWRRSGETPRLPRLVNGGKTTGRSH